MIVPTVGRVVLFTPDSHFTGMIAPGEKIPAIICKVWSDKMINIGGFDADGNPFRATSVTLVQDDLPPKAGYYCEWMPYQKGQATKTEQAEKALAEAKAGPPLI